MKAGLSVLLNVQNLLTCVETANGANLMILDHLVALGVSTLGKIDNIQLGVVGSSGISASLGNFTLWYCHFATSSWAFEAEHRLFSLRAASSI